MLLGNHDYVGNTSAQIEYAKTSKTWRFPATGGAPAPWYSFTKSFVSAAGATVTAEFFMLDTVLMGWGNNSCHPTDNSSSCPHTAAARTGSELTPQPDGQGAAAAPIDAVAAAAADPRILGDASGNSTAAQVAWLAAGLESSTADWKIVAGHYPVYSIGYHGPTPSLLHNVKPLLEKHNVPFFVNGHDHNSQHIVDGSTEYLTCGNAEFAETQLPDHGDLAPPANASKFFWPRPGMNPPPSKLPYNQTEQPSWCQFEIHDATMATVRFVGGFNSSVLHTVTKTLGEF